MSLFLSPLLQVLVLQVRDFAGFLFTSRALLTSPYFSSPVQSSPVHEIAYALSGPNLSIWLLSLCLKEPFLYRPRAFVLLSSEPRAACEKVKL